MNMQKNRPWRWHVRELADPEILALPEGNASPVKRNPVRSVFKVTGRSGKNYFVKIEKKPGLLSLLRNRFRSKARSEFESALLLESLKIPCAKYTAWGTRGNESCVISEALEGFVSSPEYFCRIASNDPSSGEKYLKSMAELAGLFYQNGLLHPDFHAGNIMIHETTGKTAVIDPYGIRRKCGNTDPGIFFPAFLFMRTAFPEETIISFLASAMNLSPGRAHELFARADQENEKRIEHEWPRRKQQILSGNSKFCRSDGRRTIRSFPWYAPAEWDEKFLESVILPEEKALPVWLDSFRDFLLCRRAGKLPVIRETLADGNVKLFFAPAEKLSVIGKPFHEKKTSAD